MVEQREAIFLYALLAKATQLTVFLAALGETSFLVVELGKVIKFQNEL